MTTATGLAALALIDARLALSQCAAVQVALEVDEAMTPAAAAVALGYLEDAEDDIAEPYYVLSVRPSPPDFISDSATLYQFEITVEFALPPAADADSGADDFVHALNLSDVIGQLRALYDDHTSGLSFDLAGAMIDQAVREDETGAQAGVMLEQLVLSLECVDA